MRPRTTALKLISVVAAIGLVSAACSSGSADDDRSTDGSTTTAQDVTSTSEDLGEPQRGGELVIGVVSETNSWYPPETEIAFSAGQMVAPAFFETLFVRTGSGEIIPNLAAAPMVPNEDATAWTVTLRPGITFHDGTALDADALIEMGELWDTGRFATPGEGIEQTLKVDDLTVTYVLHESDPAFGDTLQGTRGIAFSPTAARAFGEDAAQMPVGTGPFIFRSWTRDSELVATRNPNYWQEGLPYLDRVTFRVLPDGDSRRASVAAGDLDMATQGGATGMQDLVDSGFVAYEYLGNGAGVVIFNTLQAPTDDVRVRRGLAAATDPDSSNAILTSNLSGAEELRSGYFSSTSKWFSAEAGSGYAFFDLDAAAADLDSYVNDAARSDGKAVGEPISFTYECNSEPENLLVAQLFQQEWGDLGVDVDITTHEQSTFVTKVLGSPTDDPAFKGDFNVTCWADGTAADPLSLYDSRYGAVAQNVLNWTNYTNPGIDTALDQLRSSLDFDTRFAAAAEITRITAADMPIVWGSTAATVVITKDNVKNLDGYTHPDGTPGTRRPAGTVWFQEIWIDGAQPIDIPTELIELPEVVETTTTTTEAPPVLPGADEAILSVIPGFEAVGSTLLIKENPASPPTPLCPGVEPLDGLSPISISTRSLAGATDFGPFMSLTIYDMEPGEADLLMDAYLAGVAGDCAEYTDRTATGAPLNLGYSVGEGPTYGDRSVTLFNRGDSDGTPVNADVVLMRVGDRLGYIGYLAIFGEPDIETRDAAAALLEAALQPL